MALVTIRKRERDGVIFDLDGVLTETARLHAGAWKRVFDPFLKRRAERLGEPFRPFDDRVDYLAHVDGRKREDGVRTFLASRGIHPPEGGPDDPPEAETVRAVASTKDAMFQEALAAGVEASPGARALLEALRDAGLRIAVASSSRSCAAVLAAAGLDDLIEARVDGLELARLALPGKPHPAMFLEAANRLGLTPGRLVVFEDALAGVEAAHRGGFGLVVGVDRAGQAQALRDHGAEAVVETLTEVSVSP